MTCIFRILTAALLLLLCSAALLQAETVHLSAALGMKDALNEIAATYSSAHPAVQVQPNFAAAGILAKQIEQGAPADIFISANQDWVNYLADRKLVTPETKAVLAFNQLVFISTMKAADFSLEKAASLNRVAIGNPQTVPCGQYAKQALEKVGVYAAMERDKKFVLTADVRQALMYADIGEADGAFVYATDALLAKKAKVILHVPEELHDRIVYPMAVTASGLKNAAAKEFAAYLSGPEAKAVLEKYGFEVEN